MIEALAAIVGVIGGAIASVTGFGIGSTLTPLLTYQTGARLAVAAVSIPHLAGTALRLWRLRQDIDHRVLWTFGLMNAAGGLAGALLHSSVENQMLRVTFGSLLIFAGVMGLTGWSDRMRFARSVAWVAGFLSGGLGGLAGTQGGVRAAALMGFDLSKQAFVATTTAIGILVDLARMPVYLWMEWEAILSIWPLVALATVGVLVGTLAGEHVLRRIPEQVFRKVVSALIVALGLMMTFAID